MHEVTVMQPCHRRLGRLLIIGFLSSLMVACSDETESTDAAVSARNDPEMLERRSAQLERKFPERAPQPGQESTQAITGEVPRDVLDTVLLALEKLTGGQRSDFETITAEEVMWPDGALGCPQPGMIYTQATITGYHIVMRHNGREYDYRSGGESYLMLCLEPNRQIPSGTAAPVR
jgi:hypothetical protein